MWFVRYYWLIVAAVLFPVGIYVSITGDSWWAWGLIMLAGPACSVHSLLIQIQWDRTHKRSV